MLRLWSILEEHFSKSVFVYASHSLTFAARPSIEHTIILRSWPANPVVIDTILETRDDNHLEPFLGPLPGVLAYQQCLLVEGTAASLDQQFYARLVGKPGLGIVPAGGSADVLAAVKREGIWQKIAPDVKILGVIDRDFKSDEEIRAAANSGCIVLDFHELKSYFCDPQLLEDIHRSLGTAELGVTVAEVSAKLACFARRRLLEVTSQRACRRIRLNEDFSLSRGILTNLKDYNELVTAALSQARSLSKNKSERLDEQHIKKVFRQEFAICKAAISNLDITKLLQLFPGKEFLLRLLAGLGLTSAGALSNAVFKHLDIDRYPAIHDLRNRIKTNLGG